MYQGILGSGVQDQCAKHLVGVWGRPPTIPIVKTRKRKILSKNFIISDPRRNLE